MMFKKQKNRKGQEEMVGFVLIVVLVAVVFLVFLGIMLRQGKTEKKESSEIYQFLESALEYTSNCSRDESANYYALGELIKKCNEDRYAECANGDKICDVFNKTIREIIESSFQAGENRPIRGYIFEVIYSVNKTGNTDTLTRIEKGNCSTITRENSYPIPSYSGTIESSFKLCF